MLEVVKKKIDSFDLGKLLFKSLHSQSKESKIPKPHLSLFPPRTLTALTLSLEVSSLNYTLSLPFTAPLHICCLDLSPASSFLLGISPSQSCGLPTGILLIFWDNLCTPIKQSLSPHMQIKLNHFPVENFLLIPQLIVICVISPPIYWKFVKG